MSTPTWHPSTDHEVASMSEGLCPQCAARLAPPDALGRSTAYSGICPTHGWYIIRSYPERGRTLTFVKSDVRPPQEVGAE